MFMKRISFLLFAGLLALSVTTRGEEIAEPAANTEMQQETQGGVDFDPGAVIIGHVTDAHSWHMFDYYDKDGNEHAVAIPLPIILLNDGHLDIFMSSRFHHGHADYKGYRLVGGGMETEEIVCVDEAGNVMMDAEGKVKKPLDFSITKVAAAIMIIVALLIVLWPRKATRNARTRLPKVCSRLWRCWSSLCATVSCGP